MATGETPSPWPACSSFVLLDPTEIGLVFVTITEEATQSLAYYPEFNLASPVRSYVPSSPLACVSWDRAMEMPEMDVPESVRECRTNDWAAYNPQSIRT